MLGLEEFSLKRRTWCVLFYNPALSKSMNAEIQKGNSQKFLHTSDSRKKLSYETTPRNPGDPPYRKISKRDHHRYTISFTPLHHFSFFLFFLEKLWCLLILFCLWIFLPFFISRNGFFSIFLYQFFFTFFRGFWKRTREEECTKDKYHELK